MLPENVLRDVLLSQETRLKNAIPREIQLKKTSRVTIISGIRRCGKSTLLKQVMQKRKKYAYANFEDPRLKDFELDDFYKIEKIFSDPDTYFFDEIQNIPEWERYIRHLHDRKKEIFITGSNASLLSRELGTKLTGRYTLVELYPFSYSEFLTYLNKKDTLKSFKEYLKKGGFPEYLKNKEEDYLRTLLQDIIFRDIVVRHNITNHDLIQKLAVFLLSNISKQVSFRNISRLLGTKSINTVLEYANHLSDSYLLGYLPQYSYSVKKQVRNPKKVYAIDTGLARQNSLSFSEDHGRLLENYCYQELNKRYEHVYYYDTEMECDFITDEYAIQVTTELHKENYTREINALKNAMEQTQKKGIILTLDTEDTMGDIRIMPARKFFN